MRKLGIPYGIYVPHRFTEAPQYKHMLERLTKEGGGYTIRTAVDGGWLNPKTNILEDEGIVIVETRAPEFDYAAYTRIERAQGEFAKWLTENGEIEVMRYIAHDRYFMQRVTDKV